MAHDIVQCPYEGCDWEVEHHALPDIVILRTSIHPQNAEAVMNLMTQAMYIQGATDTEELIEAHLNEVHPSWTMAELELMQEERADREQNEILSAMQDVVSKGYTTAHEVQRMITLDTGGEIIDVEVIDEGEDWQED